MKSGIYKLSNKVTKRKYIGSAMDLTVRKRDHFAQLRAGKHRNPEMQADWNLYGEESFCFEVLEYCPKEQLIEREQSYLPAEKTQARLIVEGFYNLNPIAKNSAGIRMSESAKEKLRESWTPERRKAISEKAKARWADEEFKAQNLDRSKQKSPELRKINSEKAKQRWADPAFKAMMTEKRREREDVIGWQYIPRKKREVKT